MAVAGIDGNSRQTLTALASDGSGVIVDLVADKASGRLLVDNANSSSGITVGSTVITGGTTTKVLYDNAGVVGEYTISGTGTTVAMAASPVFTNPTLGIANATSLGVSGVITTGANGGTNGSITFSGSTSGTTVVQANVTASGVLTLPAATDTLVGKATTDSLTNKTFNTAATGNVFQINGTGITAVNGTGAVSLTTSPSFITPVLGAATATSINGNTFTTGTYTLTGTAGKTLNFTNTLTFSGTDSTTLTFPATTATIARTDAAQAFTGTQTFSQVITTANTVTVTSNAGTVPITSKLNNFTNSSAATMAITMATSSAVDGQTSIVRIYDFSGVAQTIGWTNTENSTVSVPTTSNGSTTSPLTVGFMYNASTSKFRCVAVA